MSDHEFSEDHPYEEAEDVSYFGLNRREDADYFHLSVSENAVDSLETAVSFLSRPDNLKWKWIAIALHHSLYSFSIACLENGNYRNAVSRGGNEDDHVYAKLGNDPYWMKSTIQRRPSSAGYTIKWVQIAGEPPSSPSVRRKPKREELIGFWVALARVQDQHYWMGRLVITKALQLSEEQWQSIEWLTDEVRNGSMHFIPKGLAVSIDSVKKASLDIIRAIEHLALYSRAVLFTHRDKSTSRVKKAVVDMRTAIKL